MERRACILYLDDEVGNLTGFKAAFRRHYDIDTATTASEARRLLAEKKYEVIFADQRMPEISGVDFFDSIKEEYPLTLRILVTAYADINAVIDAINKGQVYRYLAKPWREEEVHVAIKNAIELYHSREELKQKTDALQKAYDELNRFVYSASHDMRAPLTSILGVVELAQQENRDEHMAEYLRMIANSVKKLDVLNNNVIDYYINNKKEERLEIVDFKVLVEEAIDSLRFYLSAGEVNFDVQVTENQPLKVDGFRLRSVINNLLSNAIKFQRPENPDKLVSIHATIDGEKAHIVFSDNGIGIKRESQQKVFDMFYRATIINSGSGIGLYITKESVEKLGGKILVESEEGKGTKFDIIIPNLLNVEN